jgi:hypothetical protein
MARSSGCFKRDGGWRISCVVPPSLAESSSYSGIAARSKTSLIRGWCRCICILASYRQWGRGGGGVEHETVVVRESKLKAESLRTSRESATVQRGLSVGLPTSNRTTTISTITGTDKWHSPDLPHLPQSRITRSGTLPSSV